MSAAVSATTPLTPKAPPPRAAGAASDATTTGGGGAVNKYNPRPPMGARSGGTPTSPADGSSSLSASSTRAQQRTTATGSATSSPTAAAAAKKSESGAVVTTTTTTTSTVDKGQNASPLHDVELYQALVKQLPDCPVIDSILFTHRGVLEDAETPQEQLTTLGDRIEKWRLEQRDSLDKQYAAHLAEAEEMAKRTYSSEIINDEKRDAKISDLSMRIEALETAVHKDVSRVMSAKTRSVTAADGGPPEDSPFRKEWELLQIKKKERESEAAEECERIRAAAEKKDEAQRTIAYASDFAKLGINEQLTRCALLSEQEHDRLIYKKQMVLARERICALDDAREYISSSLVVGEAGEWERLMGAFSAAAVVV